MAEASAMADVVTSLITALPGATSIPERALAIARRHGALPVIWDIGGVVLLTPDAKVLDVGWDDRAPTENADPLARNRALFQGARRFPPLASFVPPRPADARTCPHCNGTGTPIDIPAATRGNLICFCGGAGWLPTGRAVTDMAAGNPPWISGSELPYEQPQPSSPSINELAPLPDEADIAAVSREPNMPNRGPHDRFFWPLLLTDLGAIALIVSLVRDVMNGRGGEPYWTPWGWKATPIGSVVLLAVLLLVGIVGLVVAWWQQREERRFDRRYPKRT
jgi:hypothetical protein